MTPALAAATIRVIAGRGLAAAGAHSLLAMRVADRARALGWRVRITASRCSGSRYLDLVDPLGRPWLMRISNHTRPRERGQLIPHLDLISCDGVAGIEEAERFLADAASGAITWRAPLRDRQRRWRA